MLGLSIVHVLLFHPMYWSYLPEPRQHGSTDIGGKGYDLPPEETDQTRTCPWSLWLGLRISAGNRAVLNQKLGNLGPLGRQIEWCFTILVLHVHVYSTL